MSNGPLRLSDCEQYQLGESFHPGLAMRIADRGAVITSRLDAVVGICSGSTVIHVGCVDHLPLLKQKRDAGTWLHGRLDDACKRCVGIDINAPGIAALRAMGYDDVYELDIQTGDPAFLFNTDWDYVVLGEMIEHLDDPTAFLAAVHKKFRTNVKYLVLTTPNAFYLNNFRNATQNVELVNTDHRIWFTPFTLAKAISRAGFHSVQLGYAHGANRPKSAIKRWVFRAFPAVSMNLIAVAKF